MPCVEPSAWQCVAEYCSQQEILHLGSTCRFLRSSLIDCIKKHICIDTYESESFDYESFVHWMTVRTNRGKRIQGELVIDDYYNDDDWIGWSQDCMANVKRLYLCGVTWGEPVLPSLEHLELESSSVDIHHLTGLKSLVLGEPSWKMYLLELEHLTGLTRLDVRIGEEEAEWLDDNSTDTGAWPLIAQLTTLDQLKELCIAQLEPHCDYNLLSQLTALSKLSFRTITLDGGWFDGTQLPQVKELVLDNEAELHSPAAIFRVFVGLTSMSVMTTQLAGPALTSLRPLSCLRGLQELTVRPWLPNFDTELSSMTRLTALTQVNKLTY